MLFQLKFARQIQMHSNLSKIDYPLNTFQIEMCYDIQESKTIPGLFLIKGVIDNEKELIDDIDSQGVWNPITNSDRSRRVQHYGYKYNYMTGEKFEPIPNFLKSCKKKLKKICKEIGIYDGDQPFNSCIINEYLPGQGIAAHTDHYKFGSIIGCFTVGSTASMVFTPRGSGKDRHVVTIRPEPGSLYIMSGEARKKWKHGMPARKGDKVDGKRIERGRRISITFRHSLPKS